MPRVTNNPGLFDQGGNAGFTSIGRVTRAGIGGLLTGAAGIYGAATGYFSKELGLDKKFNTAFNGGDGPTAEMTKYRSTGVWGANAFQQLQSDQGIDDITRQELLDVFQPYNLKGDAGDIGKAAYLADNIGAARKIASGIKGSLAGAQPLYASRRYISDKLRNMRNNPGMTQTRLSDGANISQAPILTGKTPVDNALAIAMGNTR